MKRMARWWLGAVLLWALWPLFPVRGQAETPPLSLEAYGAEISAARDAVAELRGKSDAAAAARLDALADRWETFRAVRLSNGEVLTIDSGPLVAQMRVRPPQLRSLEQDLAAMEALLRDWKESPAPDPAVLKKILAQPEFSWEKAPPGFIEELMRKFFQWLSEALQNLNLGEIRVPSFMDEVVVVIAVIAIGLLLFYFLGGFSAEIVGESRFDPEGDEMETLTAVTALDRARQFSDTGDYRTAVRYLYLSSLLLLEERGLLRYDRALTNREYLRNLSGRPQLIQIFGDVVDIFDRVWYGYEPLDDARYQYYVTQIEALKQAQ